MVRSIIVVGEDVFDLGKRVNREMEDLQNRGHKIISATPAISATTIGYSPREEYCALILYD